MGFLPAAKLEGDPDARAVRQDARATIRALQAILESPAYSHNIDLAVLTKIAADETVPARERRRAAEVLFAYRLRTLTTLAELLGAREQSLAAAGLEAEAGGRPAPSIIVHIGTPKTADVVALRQAPRPPLDVAARRSDEHPEPEATSPPARPEDDPHACGT